MSSANYVKFGPAEMVVQFLTDRGELKNNENGEYFFRGFADRKRFACISPDLERRLIDLDYRAFDQVGIARQTRNRTVIWKVRLVEPATQTQPAPAPPPAPKRTPPPLPTPVTAIARQAAPVRSIPQTKYAPPPVAWPETEMPANGKVTHQTPAKPAARAEDNHARTATGRDELFDDIEDCVLRATNIICKAQKRAVELGCPTISLEVIQDLACTIIIQEGKERNINMISRDRQRVNGGADPWRH